MGYHEWTLFPDGLAMPGCIVLYVWLTIWYPTSHLTYTVHTSIYHKVQRWSGSSALDQFEPMHFLMVLMWYLFSYVSCLPPSKLCLLYVIQYVWIAIMVSFLPPSSMHRKVLNHRLKVAACSSLADGMLCRVHFIPSPDHMYFVWAAYYHVLNDRASLLEWQFTIRCCRDHQLEWMLHGDH